MVNYTYTIGSRPTYSLVSEMLEKALESLPVENHQLTEALRIKGMALSNDDNDVRTLEIKGDRTEPCLEKATVTTTPVIENLFGIMKSEVPYIRRV